ncbi:hypothetical protein V8C86DRAFT_2491849 [Haematococcus lacustris]
MAPPPRLTPALPTALSLLLLPHLSPPQTGQRMWGGVVVVVPCPCSRSTLQHTCRQRTQATQGACTTCLNTQPGYRSAGTPLLAPTACQWSRLAATTPPAAASSPATHLTLTAAPPCKPAQQALWPHAPRAAGSLPLGLRGAEGAPDTPGPGPPTHPIKQQQMCPALAPVVLAGQRSLQWLLQPPLNSAMEQAEWRNPKHCPRAWETWQGCLTAAVSMCRRLLQQGLSHQPQGAVGGAGRWRPGAHQRPLLHSLQCCPASEGPGDMHEERGRARSIWGSLRQAV